jgi:serine/threonine protein kinase
MTSVRLGQMIGNDQVIRELGRGGMGAVYLAEHLHHKVTVALKILIQHNRELHTQALLDEAVTGAKLDHPNCLKTYEVFLYGPNSSPAIATEFIDGLNGREFLDLPLFQSEEAPLSPLIATLILEQMLKGLRAAHKSGLIHQDIKPENYLITKAAVELFKGCVDSDGELDLDELEAALLDMRAEPWIKLSDWGLSVFREKEREMSQSLSLSLSRVPEGKRGGTLVYMPLEQIDGVGISGRTDIFALGLIYYEFLTGASAFDPRAVAEEITQDGFEDLQLLLIQMATNKALSAIDVKKDPHLKKLKAYPELLAILSQMTRRAKADRLHSVALVDQVEELLEDLQEAPPKLQGNPLGEHVLCVAAISYMVSDPPRSCGLQRTADRQGSPSKECCAGLHSAGF